MSTPSVIRAKFPGTSRDDLAARIESSSAIVTRVAAE